MLKGEKIVLRPLLDSDLEFLYKIEMMRKIGSMVVKTNNIASKS